MTKARKHIQTYFEERVALPGWPQYCVQRVTLHRLINGAAAFSWLTPREKEWALGYAKDADPEAALVDYAGAIELFGTEPLGPPSR